ncbi:Lipoma HMGIC fusion partner-like 3 protein [Caenorhabditis elegans]|uniref:Lipoma HMGIC fusion partner-like 3 protein n=1 Tax=Caenorhabditis elegans TaxID=6239 RepID=Q9XVU1_CAEEL|nr:Lipoma HMGIC fusion partner-like 3 protein [Caenorhabditis elegans]CAB02318.1 Lipoma HMGIC fusion partner-like 3 protein [Caenorhabditis elegans]|eukprot:NP_503066.1 Lipoma Hmgic (HMGIC) Fusion Partner-like homolog [Caenorhabditis elegans]
MQQFSLSYHSIYTRNWRVVGAIWVLCGLCTTVLQTLALIHPTWIGSDEGGYFGLYDYCGTSECPWSPFRVRPLSMWFEISAFLVLAATVLSFLAIFSILLLVLLRDRHAFILCSWLHFFAFVFMLAGCVLYPYGWENPRVREICESKKYQLGLCQIRWPYLLAMVLVFDQLCLCCLGFALALKKPPKIPELSSLTGPTVISNTIQPVPRPRKMSLQDSFYSHSGSRLEL